ncbi:MAG: hypothetical protein N5P05_002537 [Chroococcopsis gigantea SAG 12.99]|jgi:hypothetical protein|nr:hypothetical protein [Chroococcopsis gigantea SAG 12.99]
MTDKITIKSLANSDTAQEIQNFLQSLVPNVEITSEPLPEYCEEEIFPRTKQLLTKNLEDVQTKFKQEDWNIREDAALNLAMSGNIQAMPLLLAQVNDPRPEVKHMVIYALGRITVTDGEVFPVIGTLMEFLADSDFETRLVTVQALGKIASQFPTSNTYNQEIIAHLLNCLETEDDWCVREAIAQALTMIKIEDAGQIIAVTEALKKLQEDENIFVKRAAMLAESKIEQKAPPPKGKQPGVLQWLESITKGSLDVASSYLGWVSSEQTQLAGIYTQGINDISSKYIRKDLIIDSQSYRLQIIPGDKSGIYKFQLLNTTPGGKVLGGYKLILLTVEGEDFEGNCDVAETATDFLEIELSLDSDEGVIWKTEPLPDNYQEETLWL